VFTATARSPNLVSTPLLSLSAAAARPKKAASELFQKEKGVLECMVPYSIESYSTVCMYTLACYCI
jgi:hypothetical protein